MSQETTHKNSEINPEELYEVIQKFISYKEQNNEPDFIIRRHKDDLRALETAMSTLVYLMTMYDGFDFEEQDLDEEDRN